ncbi:MAG: transcription antitermination factor NusB [Deltaproteobacteria bacterium]|nr:transcription antitermination factor NusB [Deltaproteobacteria bacterium]
MGHRRKAREVALQVLYQIDVAQTETEEAIDLFWRCFNASETARDFSSSIIRGVRSHLDELDGLIERFSENWTMARMAKVDRNILRMAVFELLHCADIPPKVTLNEAIDLGKNYGSENSSSFINGILDALYAEIQHDRQDSDQP